MEETSKALQDLFYQYTHVPLGGKEIACPYWRNKIELAILGPIGGKGNPEKITKVVEEEAKRSNFDLEKMGEKDVLDFMKRKRIGVDCSGFVFWMLDALDKEKGGNGIIDDFPQMHGREVASKASVKRLTAEEVSFDVKGIENIEVGDMIRLRDGKHVAIIISIEKDENGGVWKLTYAHSSATTLVKGVHKASIEIIDPDKSLGDQKWEETTASDDNYGDLCFFPEAGDGVKRLKIWEKA